MMSKSTSDPEQTPPTPWGRVVLWPIGLFVGGFVVAAIVSMTLIFTLDGFGAPFWLTPILFFGPFVLYFVSFTLFMKRYLARVRLAMPSPERAAAPALTPHLAPNEIVKEEWPTIPTLEAPPGRSLRYHLPTSSNPGCLLFFLLGMALFWNGIVSVFLSHMIAGHLEGKPDWCLTAFLVPFVIVGLFLIGAVLMAALQWITSLLVGGVRVEASASSMQPGRTYECLIEQSGLFRLRAVRLVLTCTESATYTAGTTTSTDNKEVSTTEISHAEAMPSDGLRGTLAVPGDAMHSFTSAHNKITWVLQVRGRVAGLLTYKSDYPILVVPIAEGVST